MDSNPLESSALRFGAFKLDLESGELHKNGTLIKLQPQPFKVLALLASHAGQLITREEIQQQIWGNETFVDFEKGLNFCIKQIRGALGDDAETPHYIETLPKRGYRFIEAVTVDGLSLGTPVTAVESRVQARIDWRRWPWVAAATGVAVAVTFALWQPWRPRLAFHQRDWVLIASFENRTGERTLDGTLEYALERELSNSQFVNVVPRERIEDALRLMKKPPDTKVDAAVGREICLRDGGVRALLTGRVEKLDTTYVLSAALVEPTRGVDVASFSEEAVGQREIVPAIRRVAKRVRLSLGEKLASIQQSAQKLEKVTTPSLHALKLFSQGADLKEKKICDQAVPLFEQALAEDPGFASAHMYLAYCYSNMGKEDEAAPHYQRAFALADTTSDGERYFILGGYYARLLKDDEKARQAFEVLVRLHPDHYFGVSNLVTEYARLGWREEAIPYILRLADLRPHDFEANLNAAAALTVANRNPAEAEPYLQRATALTSSAGHDPWLANWLQLFPAYQYWLQGDLQQVQRELTRAEQGLDSRTGYSRDGLIELIAWFYLTLGKVKAAEEWFQRDSDPSMRQLGLAWVALAREDKAELSEHLLRVDPQRLSMTALVFMIRQGLSANAEKSLLWYEKNLFFAPNQRKAVRGELALARGNRAHGISLLQEGMKGMAAFGSIGFAPPFFLASESLAQVYQQQGDFERALQVLEAASREKTATYPYWAAGPVGLFWMRTQVRLAHLYRKVGREEDARKIEDELLKLLAYADPDHPILLQLTGLKKTETMRSSR